MPLNPIPEPTTAQRAASIARTINGWYVSFLLIGIIIGYIVGYVS